MTSIGAEARPTRRAFAVTLVVTLTITALVATSPVVRATSNCSTIQYFWDGYDTQGLSQPSGHRYEGILAHPTEYNGGTPCVGYGQLGEDGSIDAAWVMLASNDGGYYAQVGIAFDPSPTWACFREFYESVGTYGHDDTGAIYVGACVSAGGNHTLEVRMTTGSGCYDRTRCYQLLIDGTQYIQSDSDPVLQWSLPLRVQAEGEVNDSNSDVPGYVCCQGNVYPFDYDGIQVQELSAGWHTTCGGYINWAQPPAQYRNSRFSTDFYSYNCGTSGGGNKIQVWTNTDS
jgi:hypothetical protein